MYVIFYAIESDFFTQKNWSGKKLRQWPYLVDFKFLTTIDLTPFGGGKSTDTVLREGVFVLQHFFTGNLEEKNTGKSL